MAQGAKKNRVLLGNDKDFVGKSQFGKDRGEFDVISAAKGGGSDNVVENKKKGNKVGK